LLPQRRILVEVADDLGADTIEVAATWVQERALASETTLNPRTSVAAGDIFARALRGGPLVDMGLPGLSAAPSRGLAHDHHASASFW
jgi:hypothetical protein